jgi:hypothetical protein
LIWLFVHLMQLVGFQNRVLVFIQWAFHYFTFSRGARLISPLWSRSKPDPGAGEEIHQAPVLEEQHLQPAEPSGKS